VPAVADPAEGTTVLRLISQDQGKSNYCAVCATFPRPLGWRARDECGLCPRPIRVYLTTRDNPQPPFSQRDSGK
jgi:hypothetical protein